MQAANESSNNLTIIENSLQKPNVRLMRHTAGELLQNKKESYQCMSNCWERLLINESVKHILTYEHVNQLGAYQPGEMYNVQKAREERGKHWLQRLHQTTDGKSQIEFPHPIPLLW